MSAVVFPVLLFVGFLFPRAWTLSNRLPERDEFEEESEVARFCKRKDNLIRAERNSEIYPVDTFVNSSILMQCKFCEERDNGLPKNWNYQKRILRGNITEVELNMDEDIGSSRIFVTKTHSLIVRNIQKEDAGFYFCRAPFVDKLEKSFNYLVDIMNRSVEDVKGDIQRWKNYSDYFFKPLNNKFAAEEVSFPSSSYPRFNVTLFTDWSEWSECDACTSVATRSRTGRCRVKPVCEDAKKCFVRSLSNETYFDERNRESNSDAADAGDIRYMIQFSIALSCKSLLLKTLLPDVYDYTVNVPDFIQEDNCTGVCKGRKISKSVKYERSITLTEGAHLTLVCPDSTIDSEVRWEHNKLGLHSNEGFDYAEGSEEPRIYIDSFNTLYLFEATEAESGNYTCFVDGYRMQEVKVTVLKRSVFFTKEFKRHLNYLALVFLLCFVTYLAGITVICVRKRREERSRGPARVYDESRRLLDDCDSP